MMKRVNKERIDYSLSGYPEISDWDIPPKPPFNICWIPIFRCGGIAVTIEDSNKTQYTFFFDKFLGRLCFGAEGEQEETAAYIKVHSKLEKESFPAIENAIKNEIKKWSAEYHELSLLKECLEKAKVYAGSKNIMPRACHPDRQITDK
jgi:hypothetical protein